MTCQCSRDSKTWKFNGKGVRGPLDLPHLLKLVTFADVCPRILPQKDPNFLYRIVSSTRIWEFLIVPVYTVNGSPQDIQSLIQSLCSQS